MPEPAALFERLLDLGVRIEYALAGEQLHRVEEVSGGSDRRVDVEPIFHAGIEVVGAVTRCRMHRAGAGLERHVLAKDAEGVARVQRVLEAHPLEHVALHPGDRSIEGAADGLPNSRRQRFGDDDGPAVYVERRVVKRRVKGDRQVRWNRPRGCGPDEDRDVAPGEGRYARGELAVTRRRQRKLDVDRGGRVILVFDFGFRQRGAAMDAPVDRLPALVDEILLDEFAQSTDDRRLVAEVHREVGVRPVAKNAEALKLHAHRAHEPSGIRPARATEIGDRQIALFRPELPVHLQLDGQPVTVETGLVGRVETGHRPRFDDEILQRLVERRAHVNVAVGIRWAVVQHELGRAAALRPNFSVQIHRRPPGERFGLRPRQAGLHRELGARQVDRVFPLRHGYPTIL
jgi:hypothetical protein